jgi:hypothetical protein
VLCADGVEQILLHDWVPVVWAEGGKIVERVSVGLRNDGKYVGM